MKYIVVLISLCGMLLLTGTVEEASPDVIIKEAIIPAIVDIHVAEYPDPFLNMNGMMKYHVMITAR